MWHFVTLARAHWLNVKEINVLNTIYPPGYKQNSEFPVSLGKKKSAILKSATKNRAVRSIKSLISFAH